MLHDGESQNPNITIDLHHNPSSASFTHSSGLSSPNDFYKSFASSSSNITINDYSSQRYIGIKAAYIIVTFTNTFVGLTITFTHGTFLKTHINLVYFYIISYTFLWPIAMILGIITAGFIMLLKKFRLMTTNRESNLNLTYMKEENIPNYTMKYLIVVFLITLSFLYVISIPTSLYIIYLLIKNKIFYYNNTNNLLLYIFILINLIIAVLVTLLGVYLFLKEKMKKNRVDLDEEFIKHIEKEVEQANKFSGIIAPNNNLIKMNNMFNRQYNLNYEPKADVSLISNKNSLIGSIHLNNPEELKAAVDLNVNLMKKKRLSMDRIDTLKNMLSNFQNNTVESKPNENAQNTLESEVFQSQADSERRDEILLTETKEDKKTRIKKQIRNKTMKLENTDEKKNFIRQLKTQLTVKSPSPICKSPNFKNRFSPIIENNAIFLLDLDREDDQKQEEKTDKEKIIDIIPQARNGNKGVMKSHKQNTKNISLIFPHPRAFDDFDINLGLENKGIIKEDKKKKYNLAFSNMNLINLKRHTLNLFDSHERSGDEKENSN